MKHWGMWNERASRIKRSVITLIMLVLLCCSSVNAAQVYGSLEQPQENEEWAQIDAADWMGQIADDAYLSTINIPGTHDSTTEYAKLSFFSKTQITNVAEQLQNGYRYMDIRLECDGDRMKLVHGFVECKEGGSLTDGPLYLDVVLSQCETFLQEHPTETIIFCVKKDHGEESDGEFQKLLYTYIEQNPKLWYLQNTNPQLADVRGKIILARRYEDANEYGDEKNGLALFWEEQSNTDVTELPYTESTMADNLTLKVQDRYCYGTEDKWDAIQTFLDYEPEQGDNATDSIQINFTSTKGTMAFGHPVKYAKTINKRFLNAELTKGKNYGWIIMDYGTEKLARHVFELNEKKQ